MTRAARGRDDASIATGIDAPRERGPEGGIVRFGMGSGAARTGGAPYPTADMPTGSGRAAGAPYQSAPSAGPGAVAGVHAAYAGVHGGLAGGAAGGVADAASAAPPTYAAYAQARYVPPATSQPVQPEKKGKRRAAFWIGLVVLVACIALAILLALSMCDGKSSRQGSLGQLEGKSDAEMQAELNRVVDEGMFNISIASSVAFDGPSAPGERRIENVPGNHYLMKVDIVRDDTGEKIYETDMIEPNHHIQSDTLDASLPAGYYDCTAIFYAFDMETEEPVGQAAAKIVIQMAG